MPSIRSASIDRRAIAAALAILMPAPAIAGNDDWLLLQLSVNGERIAGERFVRRDGDAFWLAADDVRRGRLRLDDAPRRVADGVEWVQVCARAPYRCRIDEPTQTLALSGEGADFEPVAADAAAPPSASSPPLAGFVNHELWLRGGAHGRAIGALLDANLSGGFGLLRSAWLLQHDAAGERRLPLGSRWQYDWPGSALSLAVGDTLAAPTPGRLDFAYRGVRLGTDFSLQPTQPPSWRPRLAGALDRASRIDVLVDGRLMRREALPYGPFDLPLDSPQPGRHSAEVLLAADGEAARREQLAWYSSPRLLAAGRLDWSLEAGRPLRHPFDLRRSGDETRFGALALRRGFDAPATLHALVHGSHRFASAGGGAVLNLGHWALLDAAAYAERAAPPGAPTARGTRGVLAIEHRAQRLALLVRSEASTLPPADGRAAAQLPWRRLAQLQAALPLDDGASIGVLAARRRDLADRAAASLALHAGTRFGALGATLLARRDRFAFDGRRDHTLALLLSLPLDERWDASLLATRSTRRPELQWVAQTRAQAQRPWDLRLAGAAGSRPRSEAELAWHRPAGSALATVHHDRTGTSAQGLWRGALGFIDGSGFASARIDDGFVLVRTPGHAGVPVTVDRRPVGVTGADGTLAVPALRAHERVPVAIDAGALPIDEQLDADAASVSAPRRGGAVVTFAARRAHGLLHVRHAGGAPASAGARASFSNGLPDAVIGLDGALYVGAPADGATVTIDDPRHGRCRFTLAAAVTSAEPPIHVCSGG